VELRLSNRAGVVVLVDDEDYPLVSRHRWSADAKNHVRSTIYLGGGRAAPRYGVVFLAKLIMGALPLGCDHVDHINRDPFDNRKANLRWASHGENRINSRAGRKSASGCRFIVRKRLRSGAFRYGVSFKQRTYSWHDNVEQAVAWRDEFLPAIVGPFYPVGVT
jgi:hypothetical protein